MSDKPKIRVMAGSLNGGATPVESATITLQVDSIASCSVKVVGKLSGGQRVRKSVDDEALRSIREAQQKRLGGTASADQSLTLFDGSGNNITVNGYVVAPALEASRSNRNEQRGIATKDAMLNALDLSIYVGRAAFGNLDATRVEAEAKSVTAGDIPGMLLEVTEALVATFDAAVEEESDETLKEIIRRTHENNQLALPAWRAILENSDDATIPLLGKLITGTYKDEIRVHIVETLIQMLQQKEGGFWMVLQGVLGHFRLSYIPNAEEHGKLILRDKKAAQESTQTVNVGAENIGANDGSSSVLQLGGVIMMATGVDAGVFQREEAAVTTSVAAAYPNPFVPGYIHREPPPLWLPAAGSLALDAGEAAPSYDLDAYRAENEKNKKEGTRTNERFDKLLVDLCRAVFEDVRLESSRCSITLPLDYSVRIGEVTTFKTKFNSFTGFIDNITHSFNIVEGARMSASTQLTVTHVRYS